MIHFIKRILGKTQLPDSTLDEWNETYERDLAYLAVELKAQRSDEQAGAPKSRAPLRSKVA